MISLWLARYLGIAPRDDLQTAPLFTRNGNEQLVLHVGCGPSRLLNLPAGFHHGWREIRVDLDPAVAPDLVASFTDLSAVPDGAVDALFSSHTIEHLYWFEVPQALAECRRVLAADGFLVITCPDAQEIARWIAEDRIDSIAYHSSAGPITPLDMMWGHLASLQRGQTTMAHKCGFTLRTLTEAVRAAGFPAFVGMRRPAAFDLWVLACPQPRREEELHALAARYLPQG